MSTNGRTSHLTIPSPAFAHDSTTTDSRPIAIVVGTRPEIIKVAPVAKECERQGLRYEIVHTGQHYSFELDSLIFQDLGLETPKFNLGIGSGSHAEETARALVGLETCFERLRPCIVLVQGDTNSALAGGLAASKMRIRVGHIEAGLRSFDWNMPEEKNRVLIDHISDILFAPTRISTFNLTREGFASERMLLTGNTIVDSVNNGIDLNQKRQGETPNGLLRSDPYVLLTLHREENVDSEDRLRKILRGVSLAAERLGTRVVFPAHPRTVERINRFGIQLAKCVSLVPPMGFLDYLSMERNAHLILTDSGGVQEEACILRVPCVTLRDNTERPETLEVRANFLAGVEPDRIVAGAYEMCGRPRGWDNPFGDGTAGQRIVQSIAPLTVAA